jgi:hypothetical protein
MRRPKQYDGKLGCDCAQRYAAAAVLDRTLPRNHCPRNYV